MCVCVCVSVSSSHTSAHSSAAVSSEEGVSSRDIKDLEATLAAKQEELQRLRAQKGELSAALDALNAEVRAQT